MSSATTFAKKAPAKKLSEIELLQKRLPYALAPTNVPGAFTSPAPPTDFDPNRASSHEMMKHGLLLRRPSTDQDAPEVIAAWKKAFSRKWLPKDRVVPHLEPRIGRTHQMRAGVKTNTGYTSNNWGGGVIKGNWTAAIGTWAIPAVSKPSEPQGNEGGWNSASWVGIDGANTSDGKYSSNDVLQAGVEQRVDSNGNASYTAWFEWFAPISKVVLPDSSPLTPALASLNGRMYIAWKGDGNDNLNIMVSTDNGQTFHNKFISGETSPRAPALAAHNGALLIAWKGDGNDQLNVATVNLDPFGSPTGFSNKNVLGDTSPLSPSLASVNRSLYLSWRGDGNDQLNVMVSLDNGRTFGGKFTSGETSTEAPVLGTFNGNLMIAWKGDGNDNLNAARVITNPAPTGFANKVTLGDTSPRSPALGELNGRLYIAWKGDGNDQLNVMFATDGQNFGNKSIGAETSPEAPSLVSHNGDLFIGWKGDGNDNLNVATVTELPAPAYVFQTNIANFPVKPGDTVNCAVQYVSQVAGQINFANQTTGQHTSVTLLPPPGASFSGNSAEWIMEAPDGGEPNSALPEFSTVSFTAALACPADGGAAGDPKNGDTFAVVKPGAPAQTLTSTALAASAVQVSFIG
jgi:peptidase A4-like protein